ncbi:hypothetical protein EJB05_33725, partial [Eragrostis curvula]
MVMLNRDPHQRKWNAFLITQFIRIDDDVDKHYENMKRKSTRSLRRKPGPWWSLFALLVPLRTLVALLSREQLPSWRCLLPPPLELIDGIIEEKLQRLPPNDPALLICASLVCESRGHHLTSPVFLHRYRAFHSTLPLLSFL